MSYPRRANETALDKVTDSGDGTTFLANDGEYKPVAGSGTCVYNVTATSSNITLNETHCFILMDCSDGVKYVYLPQASTCTGRVYIVKKTDSTSSRVYIDPYGSEKIDWANTKYISTKGSSISFISDGSAWYVF